MLYRYSIYIYIYILSSIYYQADNLLIYMYNIIHVVCHSINLKKNESKMFTSEASHANIYKAEFTT